jgi:hypothetical protein
MDKMDNIPEFILFVAIYIMLLTISNQLDKLIDEVANIDIDVICKNNSTCIVEDDRKINLIEKE